ncbi:MAG: SDR family oxidoreductase [Lachnospiraceae bacterium]|jgi:NAD(P)-dependent dehydrogenase (short-subunit alcohol dehydrogenase family)|nr:SDR family oxidoreductase [Lachnospiraceae bacterium]
MKSKFDLSGRTAVVTGAGQGLGKSFARSLSLAGAEVFMMARNLERLENTSRFIQEESGNTIHVWPLDITDEQSVKEACRFVMQSAGHLDILVNNAAVGRSDTPLVHESLKEWSRILETNLTGTFLMMKHVGKIMEAQKYGKIINLASVTGKVAMRNPTIGAYDVSKAGVECLTRLMAGVWAEHNINVNAICPGYYMTEINEKYVKENPGFYKDSLDCIPLKTWGKPEDIGDIAVFLASQASDYMTGATLVTDGGYMVW